jgi:hypothetical protein
MTGKGFACWPASAASALSTAVPAALVEMNCRREMRFFI